MEEIKKALRPRDEDFQGFSCNIPQLKTNRIIQANGFYSERNSVEKKDLDNVVVCSVADAIIKYSDLIKNSEIELESLVEEGVFVFVPANKEVEIPLQMLDVIKADEPILIQTNNIVILGENSKLVLIHCDDSINNNKSVSNNSTKIFLDKNSNLEYYKMENISNHASIITNTSFVLKDSSELKTFWLSLNGGDIKNNLTIDFEGEYASAELNGLYLTDRDQVVDNKVTVNHNKPNCFSNQLYKGILDDSAKANFQGHVYVAEKAIHTVAMQNNKNILLTDKATVNTQPFLEIYNDDVKCSHGATIGQLDDNAMFYLRSRGISERSAKMLLMYAFCNDVLIKASLEELKERLADIIKRRLHGELSTCDNCVLHCSTPDLAFEIDLSKV